MSTFIKKVHAREILDSRGNPTVEVEVRLDDGAWGRAAVPSGASTGVHEALELRDGDKDRYGGKGVLKAVENVNNEIAEAVRGLDALDQAGVDQAMLDLDGTPNKSKLGANAILGVSLAVARGRGRGRAACRSTATSAASRPRLLPVPMFNILNGGVHANWQGTDFQEFMIAPVGRAELPRGAALGQRGLPGPEGRPEGRRLHDRRRRRGRLRPGLQDERGGGRVILKAIEKAGYKPGEHIALALDPASSSFYEDGIYNLRTEGSKVNSAENGRDLRGLGRKYPIVVLEDGLAEDDWDGWKLLNKTLGGKIELVGDDLFVTNVERIARGIEENAANAVLIKLNQIGTLTETDRRHRHGPQGRLGRDGLPPQRRDRGQLHRRPDRGHGHRPPQDRRALPRRARREVQPADADRGGARARKPSTPGGAHSCAVVPAADIGGQGPRRP